jgi:hypothetical protein
MRDAWWRVAAVFAFFLACVTLAVSTSCLNR